MKLNNKNKILIITSILFVIIAYKTAISKTFYYYASFNNTKEQLKNSENEKKYTEYYLENEQITINSLYNL